MNGRIFDRRIIDRDLTNRRLTDGMLNDRLNDRRLSTGAPRIMTSANQSNLVVVSSCSLATICYELSI